MATIRTYPLLRHFRGESNAHVRHLDRGRVVHQGVGQAFWYRPLRAVLAEVPVDDREVPLLLHARSSDAQARTVQATVTYRIEDPAIAATRIDFGLDPDTGAWRSAPLEQLAGLVTEAAGQLAFDVLISTPLEQALVAGPTRVRTEVERGLGADPRIAAIGLAVVGVRVTAVRPDADLEKALQTPARERVQQESDRATFERRALAVERERAIAENELANQIELAAREGELVGRKGANERRRAEEAAIADRITADAQAGRTRTGAEAEADATRVLGEARGDAERARLAAYAAVDSPTLLALAVRELAEHLPQIGSITVTPDTVSGLLSKLTADRR